MKIGERIRYLRKDTLHMTQLDFAKKIMVSRANLGNIETGIINASDRVRRDICNIFGVNQDWLENGTGGDDNIFKKIDQHSLAYNRFGFLMENSTPEKKAALAVLLELLYTLPDDKWDLLIKQYEDCKKSFEAER